MKIKLTNIRTNIVVILFVFIIIVAFGSYKKNESDIVQEAISIRKQLTLEEKVKLTYGDFYSGGIPRLGINKMLALNGPLGLRLSSIETSRFKGNQEGELRTGASDIKGLPSLTSAFPSTLALAATWDHQVAYDYGEIISNEMLAINANVLLGPGINLMRDPRGGRNFEYMGEDPFLTAEMAIQYTKGLQDNKVGVCLKHYVANDNDFMRHLTTSNVDEQTLREIYVYPFERAIKEADAWSIMIGNNLLNGEYIGNNQKGLKEIMRDQIGFSGVILTDWRSAYKAEETAQATVDMTTGFCSYVYQDELLDLVKSGKIPETMLDNMVDRILTLYIRTGLINPEKRGKGAVNTLEFQNRVQAVTANSLVLLKNENNLLPLGKHQKIVVTGPGADSTITGGGSSLVNKGVKRQTIAEGLKKVFVSNMMFEPNSKLVNEENAIVVYCAIGHEGREGRDMPDILLNEDQTEEINRLGKFTDKLVVVLQNSTAVDMTKWGSSADAVLITWLGGQSFGDAVASVINGEVNPSGRLPCTFGNAIEDYPSAILNTWPAKPVNDNPFTKPGFSKEEREITFENAPQFIMDYQEKGFIGYRGFISNNIEPVYPFGFGLSYTSFSISDVKVKYEGDKYSVTCSITNKGKLDGADVVQLYITRPYETVKKLRGFGKVYLKVGETKTVQLNLRGNDLSSFDVVSQKWVAAKGEYTIELTDESVLAPKFKMAINLSENVFYDAP